MFGYYNLANPPGHASGTMRQHDSKPLHPASVIRQEVVMPYRAALTAMRGDE